MGMVFDDEIDMSEVSRGREVVVVVVRKEEGRWKVEKGKRGRVFIRHSLPASCYYVA